MFINHGYQRIQEIELAATKARSRSELRGLIEALEELDRRAMSTRIASELIAAFYSMRSTLQGLRGALVAKMEAARAEDST